MPSRADTRRAQLLTERATDGKGKTNTDLEREDLISDLGLSPSVAARMSMADLGYRENGTITVDPVVTNTYGTATYGTGTYG